MSRYRSLIFAALGAVAALVPAILADGRIDQVEGTNILLAVLGAATVWFGPSTEYPYVKYVLAALTLAAMAVQTAIIGHAGHIETVTLAEWLQIAAALVVAVTIKFFPNEQPAPLATHAR